MPTPDDPYEQRALIELQHWQLEMTAPPSLWNQATRGLQRRVNRVIPERVHEAVTAIIKQMTRAVIAGSSFTAPDPLLAGTLAHREDLVGTRSNATAARLRWRAASPAPAASCSA